MFQARLLEQSAAPAPQTPAAEAAHLEYSVDQANVRQLEERLAALHPRLRASSLASGRTDAALSFDYSTEDDSAASVIEIWILKSTSIQVAAAVLQTLNVVEPHTH